MSSSSLLGSLLGSSNSTTAIDISSILQAAMGASTPGLDVTSAVNSAVTAAKGPENIWNAEITTLQSQTSDLTNIQTATTNLDSDMQSLNSLNGPLSASTVASSNSSVVTATAAPGTAAGNNTVVVNNLASTASFSSTAVANATTTALPLESFTITNSSGKTATITTGSGIKTLSDLETAVNSAGLGVTASIITDASGARLAITSNTSGNTGNFTLTSTGTTFAFGTGVTGKNALLTVNGFSISSATNTVTGAVPGLTLNLLSASPATTVSLTVGPDTAAASTAINKFVTDYNTAISDLNSEFANVAGSGQGSLAQDPAIQNLQSTLEQAVAYSAAPAAGSSTTTVQNLTSLGITVGSDGTLSVNSTTLNNALQNNFGDVQNFFQGTAQNGFAGVLDTQLTSFTNAADGAFTVDLQSIKTEITGLQTNITNFEANVIAPLQTKMQSDFSQAEILLQQLPQQIRQINTELGQNNSSGS
ncbi:MAG TPA: flagellar filament capping protein FliD [Acidobacteriaceae bacterium]|jgi:flagellar hook-associated protein 2|nr:flagellar filament capping protein FliD [Acidobacteriaceae bacterium]